MFVPGRDEKAAGRAAVRHERGRDGVAEIFGRKSYVTDSLSGHKIQKDAPYGAFSDFVPAGAMFFASKNREAGSRTLSELRMLGAIRLVIRDHKFDD